MKDNILLPYIASPSRRIGIFVGFFAFCTIFPALIHSQWITGPFINATLLLATIFLGPAEAIFIGLFPSSVALTSGILPVALASMVPFIMIANALYIKTFSYGRRFGFWISAGIAALLKFIFLTLSVIFLLPNLLIPEAVERVAVLLTWPQLVTAIIGACIAFPVLKILKKNT